MPPDEFPYVREVEAKQKQEVAEVLERVVVQNVQVFGSGDDLLSQSDLLVCVKPKHQVSQSLQHNNNVKRRDRFEPLVVRRNVARHLDVDQRAEQHDLQTENRADDLFHGACKDHVKKECQDRCH